MGRAGEMKQVMGFFRRLFGKPSQQKGGTPCSVGEQANTCRQDELASLANRPHMARAIVSLSIKAGRAAHERLREALASCVRNDPTLHVRTDAQRSETTIAGVTESQLAACGERIRRECKCAVEIGTPKVVYREAPTRAAAFDHCYRKQTGTAGQFAHIVGRLEPLSEGAEREYEFEASISPGRIPQRYISSCDEGFQAARMCGQFTHFPVTRVRLVLEHGTAHPVDSSDSAFQAAALEAFQQAYRETLPMILEPIMRVEIELPPNCQDSVASDLAQRRGIILATDAQDDAVVLTANVPQATMLDYATYLRSVTQGRGQVTMQFASYKEAPREVQEEILGPSSVAAPETHAEDSLDQKLRHTGRKDRGARDKFLRDFTSDLIKDMQRADNERIEEIQERHDAAGAQGMLPPPDIAVDYDCECGVANHFHMINLNLKGGLDVYCVKCGAMLHVPLTVLDHTEYWSAGGGASLVPNWRDQMRIVRQGKR